MSRFQCVEEMLLRETDKRVPITVHTYMSRIQVLGRRYAAKKQFGNMTRYAEIRREDPAITGLKFLKDHMGVWRIVQECTEADESRKLILESAKMTVGCILTQKEGRGTPAEVKPWQESFDFYKTLVAEYAAKSAKRYITQTKSKREDELWIDYGELVPLVKSFRLRTMKTLDAKVAWTRTDQKTIQQVLISHLYTYVQPRRNEYCTVKVRDYNPDADNYWDGITKCFVFNQYKTAKKHGRVYLKIDNPTVLGLMNIVVTKGRIGNSPYLFQQLDGNPYTKASRFGQWTAHTFETIAQRKISSAMLRKIYLSMYLKNIPPLEERRQLANSMGHSLSMQEKYVRLAHDKESFLPVGPV